MFLKEDCEFAIIGFLYFNKDIWYNILWHMPKRGVKMPRCRKRIVCKEPDVKVFIPQQNDNSEMLIMTEMSFDEILLESKTITRKGEWNYANSGNI